MVLFNMVRYHNKKYPSDIPLREEEIAGHFDVSHIAPSSAYSLHTEYSYAKRSFSTPLMTAYPEIIQASKSGIPQLWHSKTWARSFADFIFSLCNGLSAPDVIEIHPPFDDYLDSIADFIEIYKVFEVIIRERYPQVHIHLENRCGSLYRNGKFMVSKISQIKELCQYVETENLALEVALDIPQLYTAHQVTPNKSQDITLLLDSLHDVRQHIGGVHIWGKTLSGNKRIAHCGNLNTYFNYDESLKAAFLSSLHQLFDDNQVRNLVLEVNSQNEDLLSIIKDLKSAGFIYI